MTNMAPYLQSTPSTIRSSVVPSIPPTSFTLPTSASVRMRRQQNRLSAEYPCRYHRPGKQQQRLSLMLSDQLQVRFAHLTTYVEFLCRKEFTLNNRINI